MESFVPVNRPASGTLIQQLHQLKKLAPLAAIKDPGATEVAIEVNATEVLQFDHIDDYKILEKDLSAAAATTLKNLEEGRKYDKVSVLGVYWHASIRKPDYLASHADDLLRVFSDKYNYEVKTLVLDKKTAYKDLNWNLASIGHRLGSTEENNLFILYYGGHGGFDGNDGKARLWQSNTNDASESVDWHKLQEQLRGFEFDILFLFDCCYAMAMPTEGMAWPKRCEIVAAAGERERASAKAETSFTAALTKLLEKDLEINKWTNAWRIGTVMRSRDYTSILKSTPQYAKLAKGVGSTISLIPLSPNLGLPSSSGSSSMSSRTLAETLTCSDARILFSIKTVNLPKAEEFEHMLSLLPSSVIGLEVGVHSQKLLDGLGLFKSNSGLSLLSVPVWFWYAMDSNPAYKYIDLVRSGNYLEEHRLAKQEVTTSRYCTRGVQTDKVEELVPSDPVDIVRTRRNEGYYNEFGAGLQQAILRNTEPRTITVPWHSPRKPIFSRENDRFERRIEKETTGISIKKIERDIDAYSFRNKSMDTRMNRKHRGIFMVA